MEPSQNESGGRDESICLRHGSESVQSDTKSAAKVVTEGWISGSRSLSSMFRVDAGQWSGMKLRNLGP